MTTLPSPGWGARVQSNLTRGSDFRSPNQRYVQFDCKVDMTSLPTLPERLSDHMTEALVFHMHDAARRVIVTAHSYLVRLEEPAVKVNYEGKGIHGYDTGLMYITLISRLATHLLMTGVFYDLLSEEAEYWRYVEFGFHTRSGRWWPGYHFLETAVRENAGYIRQRAREAWADTAIKLATEGQAPGFKGQVVGLTRA